RSRCPATELVVLGLVDPAEVSEVGVVALIGDVEHVTANTQFDAVAGIPLLLQRNVELSEILIVKIVGAPNGVVATARVETIVAVGPAIAGCAFERQLRRRRHAPEIDDAGANETMARDSDRADEP